jgi:hypothetical protein
MSQEERFVLLDVVGCWRILLICLAIQMARFCFLCHVLFSNFLGFCMSEKCSAQ